MWVEFVIGSSPAPRVFLRILRFSSLHKNQQFQFDLDVERLIASPWLGDHSHDSLCENVKQGDKEITSWKVRAYDRYIDDCFGATSCSRQELDYFIASVNSLHPALKYTWVVSEYCIAFIDINVSISGNRVSTSVHCKPTDSHSYLLHSSSHLAHVKNSILYSQFLRMRRLCSDDTDFSEKAEEMCQFFKTRGYPDPVIHNSKHCAQSVHPQSAPLSSHNKLEGRIPLTLTFHPHNISVKNIILKKLKVASARSHHCRDFCATTPHFIQTGQKLKQFPS